MAIRRERGRLVEQVSPLGHALRLALLARLSDSPGLRVRELAWALAADQTAVSNHLGILRTAGQVAGERDGGRVAYRLAEDAAPVLLAGFRAVLVPAGHQEEEG
jgi:DNA-binding transcriptional ArsR family regulator